MSVIVSGFGVFLSLSGVICLAMSVATNYWRKQDNSNEGLFKVCDINQCIDLKDSYMKNNDIELHAVKGLVLTAIFVSAVDVAFGVLYVLKAGRFSIHTSTLKKISVIICCVAGLVSLAGGILYAVTFDVSDFELSYSFRLCLVGGCLPFLAAAVFLIFGPTTSGVITGGQIVNPHQIRTYAYDSKTGPLDYYVNRGNIVPLPVKGYAAPYMAHGYAASAVRTISHSEVIPVHSRTNDTAMTHGHRDRDSQRGHYFTNDQIGERNPHVFPDRYPEQGRALPQPDYGSHRLQDIRNPPRYTDFPIRDMPGYTPPSSPSSPNKWTGMQY